MSNLDQEIEPEVQDILDLRTKSETPAGQDGDEFDTELDAFAEGVKAALALAERDDHDHSGESISPGELSVGSDGPATSFGDIGLLAEAGFQEGDVLQIGSASTPSHNSFSFTDTSMTFQQQIVYGFFVPPSVSSRCRIRFSAVVGNDTTGETTVVRPQIDNVDGTLIEITSENSDSGWVDVGGGFGGGTAFITGLEGKVTGGTGTVNPNFGFKLLIGIEL